jgi:hypothetical protein
MATKFRIIDAHAHLHIGPDCTPKKLIRFMDNAGVEKSAAFASAIRHGMSTERLVKRIAPYQDRLFGVAAVSPEQPAFQPPFAQVDEWLESGAIRAIKFYTGYEHFYPADVRLRPYLDLLVKHKRPAIFHSGDTVCWAGGAKLKYAHPLHVDDLATEMPELKIIIAHLGSPWIPDSAQVCYKNKNVYSDCSGFVYGGFKKHHRKLFREYWERFDAITEAAGPRGKSKILFGTDWPISDHVPYVEMVERLAGKHRDAVFHGNAEKLFGL